MHRFIFPLLIVFFIVSPCFGIDLTLKASFTPNTETDMKEYRLYRVDGTRVLIGTIPHPPALPYVFVTTAPDNEDYTLLFVVTAVDTANNQSEDSNVAPFVSNKKPPVAPSGLSVGQ